MIVVKHKKIGDTSYVSHIDTMRILQRAVRRTGLKVNYSGGYNPHMELYPTHPLPLGIQSVAEYLMVGADGISADDFLELYNKNAPRGLVGTEAIELAAKPKLVASVNVIEYSLDIGRALDKSIENIADDKYYHIEYTRKGEVVRKNTYGKVFYIKTDGGILTAGVGTGENSIRIDALFKKIADESGIYVCLNDIMRVNQYIYDGKEYVNADIYLKECKKGLRR